VSAQRGEGRSYVAANLAIVFSQLGERTLLIDADLRRPRQHSLFRLSNAHGLSSVLAGRAEDAIQRVPGLMDLSILTAGPTPPNPQELLSRTAFPRLLEKAAESFGVIIIDAPPLKESADAQTIAVRAGAVVLLARKHRSRLAEVRAAAQTLRDARASIIGIMLNEH
jgi:protein-tyrosine kinase